MQRYKAALEGAGGRMGPLLCMAVEEVRFNGSSLTALSLSVHGRGGGAVGCSR